MPKTILITGGAGFIGSMFVRVAEECGWRVVVLDALTYAGHRENLEGTNADLVVGSITDGDLAHRLMIEHRVAAVVNFAAESHVDNSISAPAAFVETNIVGTYRMLEATRAYHATLENEPKKAFRFVQVSTDEVFGSLGAKGAFSEASRYQPNSPYSASKAAGDHLARAWHHTYGLPVIVTNCSNNYGPRQHPEKLIPLMITRALSGQSLPVYGDGKNVRDWIHVEDHCRGVLLALEKGKPGEAYLFGGHAEKTNLALVEELCAYLDEARPRADGRKHQSAIAFVPDRPGHDRRYAIDDGKATQELGFERRHTFKAGLRTTVDWYLANGDWCAAVKKEAA